MGFTTYTFQSGATGTGNGTANAVYGQAALAVQVTGITSATITWEGTVDGTNYVSLNAQNVTTLAVATTATANGVYLLSVRGMHDCRARISTYVSGTITVTGISVMGGGADLPPPVGASPFTLSGDPPILKLTSPYNSPWRIQRNTILDGASANDNCLQFNYNVAFAGGTGGAQTVDDASQPTQCFRLESAYNGQAEMNWDLGAAGVSGVDSRPFAGEYNYANKWTHFAFGTGVTSGGGVDVRGGPSNANAAPQLTTKTVSGQTEHAVRFTRSDGTVYGYVAPTKGNFVLTGSTSANISSGFNGIVRAVDADFGFDVGVLDTTRTVIWARVQVTGGGSNDSQPRWKVIGDGTTSWGPGGSTVVDTTLARLSAGSLAMTAGRWSAKAGAAVASATTVTLGTDGNLFHITGTTQINLLDATGWQGGSVVTLLFDGAVTVKHNQAASGANKPLMLNGAGDFTSAADNTLTLVYDSTNSKWYEQSRKV